jgi:tetratricopeptide (TPR) repeat protein
MRLRCRNISSALVVAAVLCGSPSRRVAAAEASPAVVAPEVKADARARFDQGLKLFEKGENAAALAEFQRAYALIPNATLLYNIGLVQAAMGRPVETVDALEKLLADDSARLSVEQRRHATQVRDEQVGRIARVVVLTDRPATVEIDGVESGRTPLAAPLRGSSGGHVI